MTAITMLSIKSQIPNGEGHGGFAKLEQCDVAYALGGLRAGPAALLRAAIAGDYGESNLRDLYVWAWQEAMDLAISAKWEIPKGREILRKMAKRAAEEIVFKRLTLCPNCGGSKSVQPNQHNPTGDCTPCGNTGTINPTAEQMASIIGVTEQEWRNVWAPRYVRVYGRILEWQGIGMRHVSMRLKDE